MVWGTVGICGKVGSFRVVHIERERLGSWRLRNLEEIGGLGVEGLGA